MIEFIEADCYFVVLNLNNNMYCSFEVLHTI